MIGPHLKLGIGCQFYFILFLNLKGTVQRDFRPPVFFIIPTSLFRFRRDIQIFTRLRVVSYCAESSSAQYHTPRSQALRSIKLRGVTPILHGINSHIFKLLHRPVKGQCHKNKYMFRFCNKGLQFSIFHQCSSSRINFYFDSAQYHTARSKYFATKL